MYNDQTTYQSPSTDHMFNMEPIDLDNGLRIPSDRPKDRTSDFLVTQPLQLTLTENSPQNFDWFK